MVRALSAPVMRLQERVADRIGLELATAAGFDQISALVLFDKSADDDQGGSLFPDVHDLAVKRKALLLQAAASSRPIYAMFRDREADCAP